MDPAINCSNSFTWYSFFSLSSYGYVYLNINISYPYCVFFSIQFTYKAYCSEGYYGADCSAYCPGNPRKCVVNGHTYCKMGTFIYTSKIISKNSVLFNKKL